MVMYAMYDLEILTHSYFFCFKLIIWPSLNPTSSCNGIADGHLAACDKGTSNTVIRRTTPSVVNSRFCSEKLSVGSLDTFLI